MAGSRTTNTEILQKIEEARSEVESVRDELSQKASRKPFIALVAAFVLSSVSLGGGVWYYFENQHNSCLAANEGREATRSIVAKSMIENAEAIIAIAPDADPERVEAYRNEQARRADVVVSGLKDRDC